jgi:hypothetical protein
LDDFAKKVQDDPQDINGMGTPAHSCSPARSAEQAIKVAELFRSAEEEENARIPWIGGGQGKVNVM